MDPLKLLEAALPHLTLSDWTVSVNGARKGPVAKGTVGLRGGAAFWVEVSFAVDGTAHTLVGERALLGGPATLLVDGQPKDGHLALKTHLVAFPPEARLEIDVTVGSVVTRFDARVK